MKISCIVAVSKNNCIGKGNQIPWYLPADLKYFKQQTTGHHIIMGRKCYESIGKPLPNRTNIIITRQKSFKARGCIIVNSLQAALEIARFNDEQEAFIIGGGEIYRQSQALWDKLYITEVDIEVTNCEISFPTIDLGNWQLTYEQHNVPEGKNKMAYSFKQFVKSV